MPAGFPYFAWIDAGETVFGSEHLRWDEQVFSFTLKQDEGDPASLTAVVQRPRNEAGVSIGLLGPGRKIWAWFAFDCGPALIKFRGRLVGIPTSLFEEQVTLEFVARPIDYVAQKQAVADTLRVLPFYDPAVIEPSRRSDPDVVLEGYTKVFHYDRETHVVTVSDEITGEDGLVEFDGDSEDGKVLYDGLGLTLTSGPLSRVDVAAEYTWTQQARGTVDLTQYLTSAWPGAVNGVIQFTAGDWPKHGAALGDGWEVADASASNFFDFTVHSITKGSTLTVNDPYGSSHTTTFTQTTSYCIGAGGGIGPAVITDSTSVSHATDGDGVGYTSSYGRNYSKSWNALAFQAIRPTLVAGYTAGRQYTERVSFSLIADVQPILTDPEDGEALRIDDVKSVNLSEMIDGEMPMGDPRRRSYIATERGNRSLEHLIALARAHLMKRARVVEITFAPKLARMPEITLRKNAFLIEPRVGEALGKIVGYSLALDGSDGRINCEVRIGCAIGRGGAAATTAGTPSYCTIDYAGADYQQFVGRRVIPTGFDASVAYQPPDADPNDDGLNFLGALRASDVIETPLVVVVGPDEEDIEQPPWGGSVGGDNGQTVEEYVQWAVAQQQVKATFKLKSMTREFSTDYEVQVSNLKIPTGYDLEAV